MLGKALLFDAFHVYPPHRTPDGKGKPPTKLWTLDGLTVLANTKSEARAKIKAHLGRIPAGAVVARG